MAEYKKVNVKLLGSQANKLKTAVKNRTSFKNDFENGWRK